MLKVTRLLKRDLNIFGDVSASSINAIRALVSWSESPDSLIGGKMLSISGRSEKYLGRDFLLIEWKKEAKASTAASLTCPIVSLVRLKICYTNSNVIVFERFCKRSHDCLLVLFLYNSWCDGENFKGGLSLTRVCRLTG